MIFRSKRITSLVGIIALATLMVTASGCFHQQVVTGKEASSTVIENKWAPSFVFGLVPPPVVDTANQCSNGVARVETRISFLNGLVGGLTFNLFTPMEVKVTCAAGGMSAIDGEDNTDVITASGDVEAALQEAMQRSADQGDAVWVRLR